MLNKKAMKFYYIQEEKRVGSGSPLLGNRVVYRVVGLTDTRGEESDRLYTQGEEEKNEADKPILSPY